LVLIINIRGSIIGRYRGVGYVEASCGFHPSFSSVGTGTLPSSAEIENELICIAGLIPQSLRVQALITFSDTKQM
jgi:hypothetical protein